MKKYQDRKDKVVFPVNASYKLDGVFSVVTDGKFCSKNGNEFTAINMILNAGDYPDGTEGELYNHKLNFESIISAVKRDEPNELTELISFFPHKALATIECNTHDDLDVALSCALALGYEGVVIYTGKELLKYKPFFDEEFEITGAVEGKGKLQGMLGKFVCGNFSVPMNGTHEYLAGLWKDRESLVGKMVTVQYQNKTRNGIPRFPRGVSIRDYE